MDACDRGIDDNEKKNTLNPSLLLNPIAIVQVLASKSVTWPLDEHLLSAQAQGLLSMPWPLNWAKEERFCTSLASGQNLT